MYLIRKFMLWVALAVVTGCGGTMQGVIRGEGTPVQIHYEQGLDRDFYTTRIDGESFSGKAVNAGATSSVGNIFTEDGVASVFTTTLSGNFVAVLLGDKGSSIRCQMNYADSSGFTSLGGVGICEHSDGRTIDVTW